LYSRKIAAYGRQRALYFEAKEAKETYSPILFEREKEDMRERKRKREKNRENARGKETGVCVKTEPYIHATEPYTDATELHFEKKP